MSTQRSTLHLPLISRSSRTSFSKSLISSPVASNKSSDMHNFLFKKKNQLEDGNSLEKKIKFTKSAGSQSIDESDSSSNSSDIASARLDFFSSYQNLPKTSERNRFRKIKKSADIAYLEEINKTGLRPHPLGMDKSVSPEVSIDLRNRGMGDAYATAFSKGLKHIPNVEKLNLKENRLSEIGAMKILSKLVAKKTKYLVLADNHLGEKAMYRLVELIKGSSTTLRHLNLENTKLSDASVSTLCNSLINNSTLIKLVLAKNELGDSSARSLGNMLLGNYTLKYLDLH